MNRARSQACRKVVDFEIKNRRKARDVSNLNKGYDVEGDRNIGVFVTRDREIPETLDFYWPLWNWFKSDPKAWLYVVYDMEEDPKLVMLERDAVLRLENSKYIEEYGVRAVLCLAYGRASFFLNHE